MFQSLEYLSNYINTNKLRELFEKSISYKKINLDDKNNEIIFHDNYSIDNMSTVITNIKNSIELKNYKMNDDIIFLLNLVEKYRTEILLNKADNLLITKRVFTLVKLENSNKLNTSYNIEINIELFHNLLNYEVKDIVRYRRDMLGTILGGIIYFYIAYKIVY